MTIQLTPVMNNYDNLPQVHDNMYVIMSICCDFCNYCVDAHHLEIQLGAGFHWLINFQISVVRLKNVREA